MQAMMAKLGYEPTFASDGDEAVEAVVAGGVDVVLMDLHMPRVDGLAATAQIRGFDGIDQPWIVALTGDAAKDDRQRCLEGGMNDHVEKPARLRTLSQALELAFHQRDNRVETGAEGSS